MIEKLIKKYKSLPIELKASIWFLFGAFFQKGIAMISTPIFTRIMAVDEYGEYNVFYSWLSIISIIVTCQLSAGVYTQGLVKFDKEKNEFSSSMQGLTLFLVVVWSIIYIFTRGFWNSILNLSTFQIGAILLLSWLMSAYNFWAIEQRVNLKYKKSLLMTCFVTICQPLLCVYLVITSDDKVYGRILGVVIIDFIAYIWCFIEQLKQGKKLFIYKYWIYALRLCIPLIPHYLSQIIMSTSDRIMIERMIGTAEAGIYSLAYSISLIMSIFNTGLMQTIEPWLYKKIKKNEIGDISSITYTSLICVGVVNVILIILAPEVVSVFAPKAYYDAIWVIPPIAMSVFVSFLYAYFAVFEFYYEKTKYIALATLLGAVLNIALNYLLLPIFGYYAAGYTTLLCYIVYVVMHYYFMDKLCKENGVNESPYNKKTLIIICTCFMLISAITMLTYNLILLRYGLFALLLLLAFMLRKRIKKLLVSLSQIKKSKD